MSPTAMLAYTAGLVDGEGCIRMQRETEALSITSCYPHHLRAIQKFFGAGNVRKFKSPKPNTRTAFRLEIYGLNAIKFIQQIRPFLREKAYQADIMLTLRTLPKNSAVRAALLKELTQAKKIDYGI